MPMCHSWSLLCWAAPSMVGWPFDVGAMRCVWPPTPAWCCDQDSAGGSGPSARAAAGVERRCLRLRRQPLGPAGYVGTVHCGSALLPGWPNLRGGPAVAVACRHWQHGLVQQICQRHVLGSGERTSGCVLHQASGRPFAVHLPGPCMKVAAGSDFSMFLGVNGQVAFVFCVLCVWCACACV
jgi:hypothetical protein